MNSDEFAQCARWLYEGRLLMRGRPHNCMPHKTDVFEAYSRSPDAPPMPDEVWIPQCDGPGLALDGQWYTNHMRCEKFGRPTRYIRADAVIDGARLRGRNKGDADWGSCNDCEYRIKP